MPSVSIRPSLSPPPKTRKCPQESISHPTLRGSNAGVTEMQLSDFWNPAGIAGGFLAHPKPQQPPCPRLTSQHHWDPRAASSLG